MSKSVFQERLRNYTTEQGTSYIMSPQEEAGSSSFPFPLFVSDHPTLRSKLKRPSEAKILCGVTGDTVMPFKFRCIASCANDSTKGCVSCGDFSNERKYAAISRRSWDWETKGKSVRHTQKVVERHSCQVTDTSSWVLEKRTPPSLWAGPTIMDIELALATMRPVTSTLASPKSRTSTRLVQPSLRECLNEGTSWQQAPHDSMDSALQESRVEDTAQSVSQKTEEINDPAGPAGLDKKSFLTTKVQKRTVPAARYTVKVRSEADNVEDGYRWRKYGQKFIKSNAHPRSYYRCTDARCQVKKQVERSSTEPGILELSYEGIHLHHRPYALTSSLRPQLSEKQETTVFTEYEQQQSSSRLTAAAFTSSNKLELHRTSEKSADRNSLLEYFKLQVESANQPVGRPASWLLSPSISNATCSHPNRGLLQDLLPPNFINRSPDNL